VTSFFLAGFFVSWSIIAFGFCDSNSSNDAP